MLLAQESRHTLLRANTDIVAEPDITSYIQEFQEVARRGHKDRSTENLLLAFVELYEEHPELIKNFLLYFLRRASENRLEFTVRAFRLSFFTAVKLYLRVRDVKGYEFFSVTKWKHTIIQCLTTLDEEFVNYCLRDVSTVKIYRYIALQLLGGLISHSDRSFHNGGLSILDGGCSINIGLKCLNDLSIFKQIEIAPEVLNITGNAVHPFPLKYGRGIDKYPPSLERTLASLFPSEVKIWETLYTKLYYLNKPKIQYRQQDILYLEQHEEYRRAFDVVFLSSLLQRFPSHQIADVLVQVNFATRSRSFLIINEQISRNTIEGGGKYATFILPKYMVERLAHHTFRMPDLYELLEIAFQVFWYPDENCQTVFPGKDFDAFLHLCAPEISPPSP